MLFVLNISQIHLYVFFVLRFLYSLAVDVAPPVLVPGDRFWLCQARKGPDLDTMWYSRISCSRDYSQQGKRQITYRGGGGSAAADFEDFCIDLFDIMVSIFTPTFLFSCF